MPLLLKIIITIVFSFFFHRLTSKLDEDPNQEEDEDGKY